MLPAVLITYFPDVVEQAMRRSHRVMSLLFNTPMMILARYFAYFHHISFRRHQCRQFTRVKEYFTRGKATCHAAPPPDYFCRIRCTDIYGDATRNATIILASFIFLAAHDFG